MASKNFNGLGSRKSHKKSVGIILDSSNKCKNYSNQTLAKLMRIFENYSSSKLRIFEIVRHLNVYHTAALIYLLENVRQNHKIDCIKFADETNASPINDVNKTSVKRARKTTGIDYRIMKKFTLNCKQVTVVHSILPDEIHSHANGDKTIVDFLKQFECLNVYVGEKKRRGCREYSSRIYKNNNNMDHTFELFSHNLSTELYSKFLADVKTYLVFDYFSNECKATVYKTYASTTLSKFLEYYDVIRFRKLPITDSKTLMYILRPRHTTIYDEIQMVGTVGKIDDYIRQPFYHGFRVVVNCSNGKSRVYNVYGELQQNNINLSQYNFRSTENLNLNATFECVVLNLYNGKLKSWRCAAKGKRFILIVVDVFRIETNVLTEKPFWMRQSVIDSIANKFNKDFIWTESQIVQHINLLKCSSIDEAQSMSFDPVIVGHVYRHKQSLPHEPSYEKKFALNRVYSFMKHQLIHVSDNKVDADFLNDKLLNVDIYANLEMARFRTTCIAYADDLHKIYIATYDPTTFQFRHAGTIEKFMFHINKRMKFSKRQYVFVENSPLDKIQGTLLLRVYYNNHEDVDSIVGYEQKFTSSVYDIPPYNTKHNLFSTKCL